jgi:hypothetical protein
LHQCLLQRPLPLWRYFAQKFNFATLDHRDWDSVFKQHSVVEQLCQLAPWQNQVEQIERIARSKTVIARLGGRRRPSVFGFRDILCHSAQAIDRFLKRKLLATHAGNKASAAHRPS